LVRIERVRPKRITRISKEKQEFWEKRAKNKGRARKREIHPFAVDFA